MKCSRKWLTEFVDLPVSEVGDRAFAEAMSVSGSKVESTEDLSLTMKNVKVGGSPIDPEAHYKVAGTDYYLLMNGDGHTAFDGAERIDAGGMLDSQVLAGFIVNELGGVIGEEYSEPTGQDRIVIVEEKH